jgi:1-aminocyclopropane-1-carboxylate deaminase/D-cysteine desulfhydrase-like pyridoxal-dependent ACC family enzyme
MLEDVSPLEPLRVLGGDWGIDLWAKREDRLQDVAAGNKLRKARRMFRGLPSDIEGIISVGGVGSNHLRTLALLARRQGLGMHCIVHRSHEDNHGNLLLMRLSGAAITYCPAETVAQVVEGLRSELGNRWLFVPGGGHNLDGYLAHADAIDELAGQMEPTDLPFDTIVVASGTGTTQAGLMHGITRRSWPTRVVGISVARDQLRGSDAVREALSWTGDEATPIEFDARFRFGGYGAFDDSLLALIEICLSSEGLPLDPTYTGKAMYGLRSLVEEGVIPEHSRVLFWHTGGLINLLSEHPGLQPS